MTNKISVVKRKLDVAITQLCEVSWMFSEHPERDFTRTRKLPFRKVISFLLCAYCGGKRPLCALSGHHVWDIKIVEKDMPRKALYMSLTHERLLLPRQNGRYAAWFAAFALNSCVIEAHVKSIVEYRSTILRGGRCRRNGPGVKFCVSDIRQKSRMALESRADSGLNPLITESHGGQNGMRAGTA